MDASSSLPFSAQEILQLQQANARLQAQNEQLLEEQASMRAEKELLEAQKRQLQTEKGHLLVEKGQLQNQKGELLVEKELLQQELKELKRVVFGQKRERFVPLTPPNQLSLPLEGDVEEPAPPVRQTVQYERAVKQATKVAMRGGFPSHLPRVDVILEPGIDVSGMRKMDLPIRSCILGPARRSPKNWSSSQHPFLSEDTSVPAM